MRFHVLVEVTFLNKRVRADVAGKGFLSRVSHDMVGEGHLARLFEGTTAHRAAFVGGTVPYQVLT